MMSSLQTVVASLGPERMTPKEFPFDINPAPGPEQRTVAGVSIRTSPD
jgi:hypothetical protein